MRGVAFWVGTMTAAVAIGAAQARSGAGQPVSDAVRSVETAKNIHDSAVDVPEAVYSYAPVLRGHAFGQIMAHGPAQNTSSARRPRVKDAEAENAFDSSPQAAIVKLGRVGGLLRCGIQGCSTRRPATRSTCRSAAAKACAWRRCSATSAT